MKQASCGPAASHGCCITSGISPPPFLGAVLAANHQSLEVEYAHLSIAEPKLAVWVADCPRPILKILSDTAREVAEDKYQALFEQNATQDVYVRISQLAVEDSLRDIRWGCCLLAAGP